MNDRGRPVMLRSGVLWYADDPSPEDVRYADARTLARMPRWSGHTSVFYSVAEHCVRVARYLRDHCKASRHIQLQGLAHDGHEVYPPGDVPGPLLSGDTPEASALRAIERRACQAYRTAIQVPIVFSPEIHHADMVLRATEARDLMPPCDAWRKLPDPLPIPIEPWTEAEAWREYDRMYRDLGGVVL